LSHYFITATDTGAGKTTVTGLLLAALVREGRSACGYKPFACGDRLDAHHLLACGSPGPSLDDINPVYLKTPASPMAAALLENRQVDLDLARAGFHKLAASHQHVLVEGAGGWEVPLTPGVTLADFAAGLMLPVLLVVNNRLGCLNHTLLTLRCIEARGLVCGGIILNHAQDERDAASISTRHILGEMTTVPVIAEVMHGETEMDWPLDPATAAGPR
jgi:dethiobiotin synthetase